MAAVINILVQIFCVYVLVTFVTESKLLSSARVWLFKRNEKLGYSSLCQFCVGFWISIGVSCYYNSYELIPLLWGVPYFLKRLEGRG